MKGLLEQSNFAVKTVSSKCTTLSKTESEGEVKVKMYGKSMLKQFLIIFFKMTQPYDLNLIKTKVVKLDEQYFFTKECFQIYLIGFKKN